MRGFMKTTAFLGLAAMVTMSSGNYGMDADQFHRLMSSLNQRQYDVVESFLKESEAAPDPCFISGVCWWAPTL